MHNFRHATQRLYLWWHRWWPGYATREATAAQKLLLLSEGTTSPTFLVPSELEGLARREYAEQRLRAALEYRSLPDTEQRIIITIVPATGDPDGSRSYFSGATRRVWWNEKLPEILDALEGWNGAARVWVCPVANLEDTVRRTVLKA